MEGQKVRRCIMARLFNSTLSGAVRRPGVVYLKLNVALYVGDVKKPNSIKSV